VGVSVDLDRVYSVWASPQYRLRAVKGEGVPTISDRMRREKERGGFLKKPSNHSEEDIMGTVFRYTRRGGRKRSESEGPVSRVSFYPPRQSPSHFWSLSPSRFWRVG
jgi:hypothetical protein